MIKKYNHLTFINLDKLNVSKNLKKVRETIFFDLLASEIKMYFDELSRLKKQHEITNCDFQYNHGEDEKILS